MTKKGLVFISCLWVMNLLAQPPANYYDSANGKTCEALKTALKNITANGHTPKTYIELWTQYTITDLKPRTVDTGSANVIYDVYSTRPGGIDPYQFTPVAKQCGGYKKEGDCYNKEHSVPESWFNGDHGVPGDATDYNFIFPVDGYVNSHRSNYPYGEVASPTWTSLNGGKLGQSIFPGVTGIVYEPIDSFKGDLARAFLYFVTRYQDTIPTWALNADASQAFDVNTFPSVKVPFLKMMIKWHNLDPVSQKEICRNNGTYSYQGNRNPYIDHPEYVDLVWNSTCAGLAALPVNIIYFTGKLNAENITLNWKSANEINLKEYQIECSINNNNFIPVARVKALGKEHYSYTDINNLIPGAVYTYRLKCIDNNGSFEYSDLYSQEIPSNQELSVYPNPARNIIECKLAAWQTTASVQLTNVMGKILIAKTVSVNDGRISIPVTNINTGVYLLKIFTGTKQVARMVSIVH